MQELGGEEKGFQKQRSLVLPVLTGKSWVLGKDEVEVSQNRRPEYRETRLVSYIALKTLKAETIRCCRSLNYHFKPDLWSYRAGMWSFKPV